MRYVAYFINSFFSAIGSNLARHMTEPWTYTPEQLEPTFDFNSPSDETLIKVIKDINVNKPSGLVNISTRVMKNAFLTLPFHLKHIIDCVIESSKYPDSWKVATVTPLPKEGDKSKVNTYRPISILPLPTKLTEKILHKQLTTYLNEKNILMEYQNGFISERSTLHSLASFTDNIYTQL